MAADLDVAIQYARNVALLHPTLISRARRALDSRRITRDCGELKMAGFSWSSSRKSAT